MFKLEESSIARHANERCIKTYDDPANKINDLDNESQPSNEVDVDVDENKSDEKNDVDIEVNNDSNSDDESNAVHFPDTHVKFTTLSSQISTESGSNNVEIENNANADEESAIIYAVAQQAPRKNRVIQKAKDKQGSKKKQQQQSKYQVEDGNQNEAQNDKQKSGLKRGQRSKLKKIKEKYKDQDEEEKLKRMEILKSAGNKPKNEAAKNVLENENELEEKRPVKPIPGTQKNEAQKPQNKSEEQSNELDAEPEAEEDVAGDGNDLELLNSLTGCPHELDELLFALPVVAPYAALQNYK